MKKIFLIIAAGFLSFSVSAQFTPGNIVVVKTSGSVSKAGSAISLLEYNTSGVAATTVSIPSTGSNALQMAAGAGGSQGFLSRSADGTLLVLGGYNTATSFTTDITVSTSLAAPRAIYKVDASGTASLGYSSNTFYNANDIRGAISDGTNFWVSGGSTTTDGVNYYGPGAQTALGAGTIPVKAYGLQIFGGQIYYSTQKAGPSNLATALGIFALGSGLPTSGSVTTTQIINTGSVVPADFSFKSSMDVCYIAIPLNTSAGGIQKWTKTAGVWSLAYTLGTGVSNIGAYGLTVDYSGTNPVLYATTFEANTVGNRIIKITDTGGSSTATTLATASANTWFHGIAFAPCTAPVISSVTNNGAICSDATLNLNVSATGSAPLTYAWSGAGSFSSTTVSNPNVTGATSGNYSVSVTNACGISTSSSTTAVVNTVTTPSVIIAASPSNTICSATNVTFTATPTNGGTTPSYQWTLNGNNVGSNSNTYSNNNLANADQVACVLTSNKVCVSTTAANSNVITINVTSSVVPSLSIAAASGTTNCAGTNVVFTAIPTNGGATPTYVWKLNGNIVGANSVTYSNNTLSNQDSVVCLMTSSNGCASPTSATSNTLHLTVNALVTPSVSISPAPSDTICAGTNVTFSASAVNGGSTSYQWTNRGVNVGSNSSTYSSTSFLNNDTIRCTITSSATCRTSDTASSLQVVLNVNAVPTPTIAGTLNYCTGGSTTLDAGAGYASYSWSNSASAQTISPAAGTYSVTVSNGICTGTSPLVTVVVDTVPSQPGAFTTSSSNVSTSQSGVAYVAPSNPLVTTFTWAYSGTGATINGSGNSITVDFASNATSGNLSVTAGNNCGTSSARTIAITVTAPAVFTPGRLAVIQTSGAVSKGGSPITIKEYTTTGTSGISIALPSAGGAPIQMAAGPGGSEGFLSKSSDGSSIILAGYSTSAIGISDITVTTSASTPRIIYKINDAGVYSQVGSSTTSYNANDIRGAITDGTNYWASGASVAGVDGINYYGPGAATALAVNAKAYGLQIFNGQIYFSTQKVVAGVTPNFGIYSLGSGMPTSGTITPTVLINTGTATPADFSINPTGDVCYIAISANTASGGIQKWTKSGSVWTLAYTLGTGATNIGAYGLVGDYAGASPILYATTFEANTVGNRIIKITDTGAGSSSTTLATAAANNWYHGIAFTPTCIMPLQPSAFTSSSTTVNPGQSAVVYTVPNDVAATGYTWSYSGTGATINGTGNSVTVEFSNAATAGTLSVTANNTCGASNPRSIAIAINGALRITEFMYSGINGEFVEFTNIGGSDIDLTGWSWSDNVRTPGSHDLSSIGVIKAGQSVIATEASPSTFRTAWNLCSAIKIVGPYSTDNLGRADEINLYNGSTLVDRLTYNDQLASNVPRTQNKSAWVSLAGLGNNLPAQWTLSAVSDGETSFTSTGADIASPGKSTRATVTYDHCFLPNGLPSIAVNTILTTNYLDGAATSVLSPFGISGVLIDPSDPAKNLGIHFTIGDTETDTNSLVVTAASSNISVVPNANIILTGSGARRNVKIISANVGYANITLTVNDGTNNTVFVIAYAASVSAEDPNAASWHTGMSDGSDAVALDSAYYISGDDELNQLNVYSRYASGLPAKIFEYTSYLALPDPTKPEVDLEAGTRSMKNTNKLFWLGSMSNGKAPFASKPNRNRIFSTTVAGTGAATSFTFSGYYGDLKNQILAWGDANGYNFTASAAAGVDSKSISGFAAEGMVFGPDSTTLYIAFRAPLVPTSTRTKAVIAPVLNFETWFNNGSPAGAPTFGAPIELDLGGRGFRDLIRLPNGTYIIVAGSPSTDGNSGLYKWTGHAIDAPAAIFSALNGAINMEGAMPIGTALNRIQIVCDGGDDFLYGDAAAAKDFADLSMRKFKSTVLSDVNLDICAGFAASNTASGSATFCAGDSVTLSSNNNCSYLWSNGKTTQSIVVKRPGNYSVTPLNPRSNCSALSAPTNVNVNLMGDINRNAVVNITDFSIFLARFGNACTDCLEDIDGNGVVNISDFSLFLSQYGQTCN